VSVVVRVAELAHGHAGLHGRARGGVGGRQRRHRGRAADGVGLVAGGGAGADARVGQLAAVVLEAGGERGDTGRRQFARTEAVDGVRGRRLTGAG